MKLNLRAFSRASKTTGRGSGLEKGTTHSSGNTSAKLLTSEEVFGRNNYSIQISAEFDNGVQNFSGSPSYKSVENILSVIRAALTRLRRDPELLLRRQTVEAASNQKPVDSVLAICRRFYQVARQLAHRREDRNTLEIKDEYDVQDLLHGLLHINFDDIRPEEWTPSYGGGSSRMDFLLKAQSIVVEVKMARKGLDAKEVSEQLIIDATKYRHHQDCKTLICFVYDPSGLVKNPRGVESDLAKLSGGGLDVICVITP